MQDFLLSPGLWCDWVALRDGKLYLSDRTYLFLKKRNIVGALGLLAFLRATPDALGWNRARVRLFTADLLRTLRQELPAKVLVRRPPPKRAMGARLGLKVVE